MSPKKRKLDEIGRNLDGKSPKNVPNISKYGMSQENQAVNRRLSIQAALKFP